MIATIVDITWLRAHQEAVIVDVRWSMSGSGYDSYRQGHIPRAVFVDLDTQLASPPTPEGGRHPLPTPVDFAQAMSELGITNKSIVVGYDDAGGFSAGRLVWLLRSIGVDAALLNGGLAGWDGELSSEIPQIEPSEFEPVEWPDDLLATADDALSAPITLDARAAERYRGEIEPTDAEPGHIPGALSAPLWGNFADDGHHFLPAERLYERFVTLGVTDATQVVAYCGSGVSTCHNLIAMEAAGLGRGRLYCGSWSAYSASGRPIAVGTEPGEKIK